jgi:hypothetical protein
LGLSVRRCRTGAGITDRRLVVVVLVDFGMRTRSAEIEPSIFEMHEDGLAYVKEAHWPSITNNGSETQGDPFLQMAEGTALP